MDQARVYVHTGDTNAKTSQQESADLRARKLGARALTLLTFFAGTGRVCVPTHARTDDEHSSQIQSRSSPEIQAAAVFRPVLMAGPTNLIC